ncbi:MAG: condensation domain-containing protein [Cyanobacteria bacterium P01_H01_bin.15]
MSDSPLSRKLANLSPVQLAKLRSRLKAKPSEIQPRSQVTDFPDDLKRSLNGFDAWKATPNQSLLWFLDQSLGSNAVYNVVRSVRLYGPLNIPAFQQALHTIVQRHEALRTNFQSIDRVPYQIIDNNSDRFKVPVVDLRSVDLAQKEYALQKQFRELGQKPFNLAQDLLIRVTIIQLDNDRFGLSFSLHHIICDGWSLGVLSKELSTLYQAYCNGQTSPLSLPKLQYADYGLWLQTGLKKESQEQARRYWQEKLAGELPILELPCDRPRKNEQTYSGRLTTFVFESALFNSLKQLANETGTSLFMVLLASLKVLLHCYTQQTDIIIGSPIANRSRPEIEGTIGFFVDYLPLRTDLSNNPSFIELLTRIRQTTLDAYTHAYPFAKVLRLLEVKHDRIRPPVFSVMMTMQNVPSPDLELDSVKLSGYRSTDKPPMSRTSIVGYEFRTDIEAARFDWTILLKENQGELSAVFEANRDLFEPETIQRIIDYWQTILAAIVANPDYAIAEFCSPS